ncbi:MAG: hypothetical protein KBE01_09085 [Synergistaceae bacterium]|nr:hypothetical protein [Synergistaceae bacterium]
MLHNDEEEDKRILGKYGDLMAEEEKSGFLPLHKKGFQQEEIAEHKKLWLTIPDLVCGILALVLATLMGAAPLFWSANAVFPLAALTLLMVLSPWGCLLLSWNKREEWVFYVIGRSALGDAMQEKEKAPSKHPDRDFFISLVMITIIILFCVAFFISPRFSRGYRGNPVLLFLLFPWLPWSQGWMLQVPYLLDIDSRGLFKKMYSTFAAVAPFIFSYWLFTALPDSLSANLTGTDFLALLILTQGAWVLNWVFVALLSVYSFLCERPGSTAEKGEAMRSVIKERYRTCLKEGKGENLLPIGRFGGSVAMCLFIALPFIRMKYSDNLLFLQSAGLILLWLVFLFFIVALVRSHIADKLRCYAFREESESAALVLDEKLLARQYKSLKIAAWFLLVFYLIGGSVFY